ncbi:LuxR C-terminal-related transcriptional regulator [Nocardioides rubriscoriae]|uniref:LuxR C-terminal-related transcriptional regulator n=1 Tax=Nocardioides rubriscoriae TaxID=642762 RepID=UPI0011E029EF|nr:LuxR C-terminal-related transcriptional regulator [Nocardioides rubriscoriae]
MDSLHDLVRRGLVRAAVAGLVDLIADPATTSQDAAVATAMLAECHLAQGELGAALALADDLTEADDLARAHHALGELASATGEPELAVERFRAAAGGSGADDLLVPWRAGAALALLRTGQRVEALALARAQHDLAVATGAAYDVALALRVLATTDPSVEAASQRVPRLRTALQLLDGVEAARLRAQIETDLAGLLVLTGDDAEALALLRSAEAYAAREDLWPLQSRVRRLLDRMGEAPRRAQSEALAALTAAERRVALLALDGLTNRQIAEHLLVSVKAVEGHLSRVYRKLGLSSRAALTAALAPA